MGAFQSGFKLGADIYEDAERAKGRREELAMKKDKHKLDMEEGNLRVAESRRTAQKNQKLDAAEEDLDTYIQGGVKLGANVPTGDDLTGFNHEASRVDAYDPTSPDGQAGLARRQMSIASLKGDMNAVTQLNERQVTQARQQLLAQGVQEWYSLPPEVKQQMLANGINGSVSTPGNKYLAVQTAPAPGPDGRAGYPAMVINPMTGQARQQFIREDQAALLFGAMKLMQNDAVGALQFISAVNKDVALAMEAHNKEQLELFKAQDAASYHRGQTEIGRSNAESNRIQAEAARTNASANSTRASRESQTPSQKMEEQVNALVQQYMKAEPGMTEQQARKLALQAVTKDPDRKDHQPRHAGLEGAGLFMVNDKLYERGKDGKPVLVQLPGESKLDKAVEEARRRKAAGGAGVATQQERPIQRTPLTQMTTTPGIRPYRSVNDQITEAERKQGR